MHLIVLCVWFQWHIPLCVLMCLAHPSTLLQSLISHVHWFWQKSPNCGYGQGCSQDMPKYPLGQSEIVTK